jgi:Stress responsive A/B Barrel Domain
MMLVHIVCWKYKDETTEEVRELHRVKLRGLKAIIPEALELKVGKDVLHLDRSYDTGLVGTFVNVDALNTYTIHPIHQQVAKMGREIAAHVVSVDFETDDELVSE